MGQVHRTAPRQRGEVHAASGPFSRCLGNLLNKPVSGISRLGKMGKLTEQQCFYKQCQDHKSVKSAPTVSPGLSTAEPTPPAGTWGHKGQDAGLQHRCPWALHCVTWRRPSLRSVWTPYPPTGSGPPLWPRHATQHIGMPRNVVVSSIQPQTHHGAGVWWPPQGRSLGSAATICSHRVFTQEVTQSEKFSH